MCNFEVNQMYSLIYAAQAMCHAWSISMCSAKDLHSTYKLMGYLFIYSVYSFIHSFNILIEHSRVHAGD